MIGLIGCEFSQIVTEAFLKRGHDFISCDLLPCEGNYPDRHLQMDVVKVIKSRKFDFIGLHPPCTKIALSGNRHYAVDKKRHIERLEAIEWTIKLWELAFDNADFVYMENPLGVMNKDGRLPKPQLIHPYYFGDAISKKTCLWLKNIPPLKWTNECNLFENKTSVDPEWIFYRSKKTKSGYSKYSIFGKMPSTNNLENAKSRSKTLPGIAAAMADQWG